MNKNLWKKIHRDGKDFASCSVEMAMQFKKSIIREPQYKKGANYLMGYCSFYATGAILSLTEYLMDSVKSRFLRN